MDRLPVAEDLAVAVDEHVVDERLLAGLGLVASGLLRLPGVLTGRLEKGEELGEEGPEEAVVLALAARRRLLGLLSSLKGFFL